MTRAARANDLANALTLTAPGDLARALEQCSAEELETVARVLRRARIICEISTDADPFRVAARLHAAKREGLE